MEWCHCSTLKRKLNFSKLVGTELDTILLIIKIINLSARFLERLNLIRAQSSWQQVRPWDLRSQPLSTLSASNFLWNTTSTRFMWPCATLTRIQTVSISWTAFAPPKKAQTSFGVPLCARLLLETIWKCWSSQISKVHRTPLPSVSAWFWVDASTLESPTAASWWRAS